MLTKDQNCFLKEFVKKANANKNKRIDINELDRLMNKYRNLIPDMNYTNDGSDGDKLEGTILKMALEVCLEKAGLNTAIVEPYDDCTYSITKEGIAMMEEYENVIKSTIKLPKRANIISIISLIISIFSIVISLLNK